MGAPNLNYPDYSGGFGGYSRQPDSSGFQNFLGGSGLALNVAGTALQGYGAYQAYKEAEAQKEEERRRYEEQQRMLAEDRARAEEDRKMRNKTGAAGYVQGIQDRRNQPYQGFATRIGL